MIAPLAIDLFSGLHGWAEGLSAEGYFVVCVDIEDMSAKFGEPKPDNCALVIQDVLTLHGSQFRNADLIVASPPCQEYSYMAMPWSRAKAKAAAIRADETGAEKQRLTALFDACFRIQREACEAAGHHIPMVVENVRGAQSWVGRARWNFGSFYIWGDVPAIMPAVVRAQAVKVASEEGRRTDIGKGARFTSRDCGDDGRKLPGFRFDGSGGSFQTASVNEGVKRPGIKLSEEGFNCTMARELAPGLARGAVKLSQDDRRQHLSSARKAASARIAKIPTALSRHVARVFYPSAKALAA